MIIEYIAITLFKLFIAIYSLIPQNTISIGFEKYPTTFLPHQVTTDSEKAVADLVFRKLFKYESGELKNDLVETWSANDNFTEFKFRIKKEQKWQDGKLITSDDVLYSMTLYQSLRNSLEIQKIGQYEILVKLTTPNSILPTLLTIGIEPAHLAGQDQLAPIGSTSYHIARVSWEQQKVNAIFLQSFQKNKTYPKVIIRFYNTQSSLFTGAKLGEIDAFLSNQEFKWTGYNQTVLNYIGRYYVLFFNNQKPELADQNIRETLSKSLDIKTILESNYYSRSIMAQGPISNSIYTKENFLIHNYDPQAKLTTIQKNTVQQLTILLPNNQDGRQIQTYLIQSWEKNLGIQLTFEYLELSELFDRARDGSYDVLFVGLETSPDPDLYDFWHSSQTENLNLSKFIDPRADRALEEGRQNATFETRKEHYYIFQDAIAVKVPAVFLYHPGEFFYNSSKKPLPLPKKIYYPTDIVKNL